MTRYDLFNTKLFSGVLVVYIHSAENLNSDTSQCNPYCTLFNNRKKVRFHLYTYLSSDIDLLICRFPTLPS